MAAGAALASVRQPRCGFLKSWNRILLVGEGDFSFAAALATTLALERDGGSLVATTIATKRDTEMKYPRSVVNVANIEACGGSVHFGVDATKLVNSGTVAEAGIPTKFAGKHENVDSRGPTAPGWFDAIVWLFPHVGGSGKMDVELNQALIRSFLDCSSNLVHPGFDVRADAAIIEHYGSFAKRRLSPGRVHVILRSTAFYDSWGLRTLADGKKLELDSVDVFNGSDFPGYAPVRTDAFAVRAAPSAENATRYIYTLTQSRIKRRQTRARKKATISSGTSSITTTDTPITKKTSKSSKSSPHAPPKQPKKTPTKSPKLPKAGTKRRAVTDTAVVVQEMITSNPKRRKRKKQDQDDDDDDALESTWKPKVF